MTKVEVVPYQDENGGYGCKITLAGETKSDPIFVNRKTAVGSVVRSLNNLGIRPQEILVSEED